MKRLNASVSITHILDFFARQKYQDKLLIEKLTAYVTFKGHVAESQYTRELLFSTVVGMMLEVVCGVRKSMNAAYRALVEEMPVSVQAVYDKLKGLEPGTTAELVRYKGWSGHRPPGHLVATRPRKMHHLPALLY